MPERKNKQQRSPTNERASGRPRILDEQATATYSLTIEEKKYIASKGGSKFVRLMLAEYRKNNLQNP